VRTFLLILALGLISLTLTAADISGTWSADVKLDAGNGNATFVLEQKGETLSGTYAGALGTAKVTGTVKGTNVEWEFDHPEAGKITYKGTLSGTSKIEGTVDYGQLGKGTFTAQKK
jgi:hypothetical protein